MIFHFVFLPVWLLSSVDYVQMCLEIVLKCLAGITVNIGRYSSIFVNSHFIFFDLTFSVIQLSLYASYSL